MDATFSHGVLDSSSVTDKLWLSRMMVQVTWRKRHVEDPSTILHPFWIALPCELFGTPDNDHGLVAIK